MVSVCECRCNTYFYDGEEPTRIKADSSTPVTRRSRKPIILYLLLKSIEVKNLVVKNSSNINEYYYFIILISIIGDY